MSEREKLGVGEEGGGGFWRRSKGCDKREVEGFKEKE